MPDTRKNPWLDDKSAQSDPAGEQMEDIDSIIIRRSIEDKLHAGEELSETEQQFYVEHMYEQFNRQTRQVEPCGEVSFADPEVQEKIDGMMAKAKEFASEHAMRAPKLAKKDPYTPEWQAAQDKWNGLQNFFSSQEFKNATPRSDHANEYEDWINLKDFVRTHNTIHRECVQNGKTDLLMEQERRKIEPGNEHDTWDDAKAHNATLPNLKEPGTSRKV